MGSFDNKADSFKSMRGRRWDIVREETARYRNRMLKKMTAEQAYEEFLALYELGEAVAQDIEVLNEKEAKARIRLVQKRQAIYRAAADRRDDQ
jgi:hypothetical protein